VSEAEARLRTLGCPKVNLQVRASNAGVAEFYRRLGYQVEERISFGKSLT
jgi:ribosomal protein S18 acetylase RimI-like enzyme